MASEDLNRSEPVGYVGPKVEHLGTWDVPDTPEDARLVVEILEGIERKSDALRRGDWGDVRAIDQALTKAGWTSLRRAQANTQRSSRPPTPPAPRPRSTRPRRSTRSRAHRRRGPPSSDDSPESADVELEPLGGLLAVELVELARRIAEGR